MKQQKASQSGKKQKVQPSNDLTAWGFKGTDWNCVCRGQKYRKGRKYTINNGLPILCCNNGFHLCEKPLDVLSYYGPVGHVQYNFVTSKLNRFFYVEGYGESSHEPGDSKVAVRTIKICDEIGLLGLAKAHLRMNLNIHKEAETDDFCLIQYRHTVANKRVALLEAPECMAIDPDGDINKDNAFRWAECMSSYVQASGKYAVVMLKASDSVAEVSGDNSVVFIYGSGSDNAFVSGNNCVIICSGSPRITIRGQNCLVMCTSGIHINAIPGTTVIWRKRVWYNGGSWEYAREVIKTEGIWTPKYQEKQLVQEVDDGKA